MLGDSFETQEKILAAALKLFAQKGYNGTATVEIAQKAGVSEASIFKYYKTKKTLLHSVLKKIVSEIIPGIAMHSIKNAMEILATDSNPKESLKKILLKMIGRVEENIGAFKVLINEVQYHEDIKKEYLGNFVPKIIDIVERTVKNAMDEGEFKELSSRTAARSLISMLALMMLDAKVLGTPMDFEKELDTILEIYFNGVMKTK